MINKKFKGLFMPGVYVSLISWISAWIILVIKLDFWTLAGFVLYGVGLSGLIIWIFVPKMILLLKQIERR